MIRHLGLTSTLITFEVVKESYGRAIRRDDQMMTPMWCRALAEAEAERMVQALRRHGCGPRCGSAMPTAGRSRPRRRSERTLRPLHGSSRCAGSPSALSP